MRLNELSRWQVWAGMVALAALLYLLLVHWWWTAPMLEMGDRIQQLRDDELALRMEAAQREALQQSMAQVREFEAGNAGFLSEANRDLAAAALVQRLEAVVGDASPNPAACQITARTPTTSAAKEPFERGVVQVRLRCGMGELAAVLHALESGSPQLFIDNLDLLARRSYLGAGQDGGGALDVSFDLYGYLKSAAGVTDAR